EVADAVRDHYKPLGPADAMSTNKVSVAVALADKLDQLVGFFAIDERPTGSGDPYALRRAALGIIRILIDGKHRLRLMSGEHAPTMVSGVARSIQNVVNQSLIDPNRELIRDMAVAVGRENVSGVLTEKLAPDETANAVLENVKGVLPFFADRLKVALKEKGTRHDLIDAVFSLGNEDDLVRLVARVEALQAFLKSDDGANLLAGYKRAANILKAEEKKDGKSYDGTVAEKLLTESAEKLLFVALTRAEAAIAPALEKEDFAAAMREMSTLRGPVDEFFDKVKVNADDAAVRANRLNLLSRLRATLHRSADFSKIEG
ncbi:MAG TPA: glycine--tRNA ligase subunit beta, partial [Rhizomicrobium sp.]